MTTEATLGSPDYEIVNSRIVNFPVEKVFEAWTIPQYLQQWWGPAGFSNTFHEFDLRPGGRWKFTMHGPEKGNYENHVEFITIEKPNMIYWKRHSQPLFRVLATFEKAEASKTKIIFRMIFDTPEECAKIKKYVVDKNEENFDRLEAVLAAM